jgi:hypothetical protein
MATSEAAAARSLDDLLLESVRAYQGRRTIMRFQTVHKHPLGPDELKLAAKAFEGALECSAEIAKGLHPLDVRKTVASAIMEGALAGERDERRLRERAIFRLRQSPVSSGTKLDLRKKAI